MSVANTVNSIRKKLSAVTKTVVEDIGALRKNITGKRQELHQAQTAPLPIAEVEQRVKDLVKCTAEQWLEEQSFALIQGDHGIGSPDLRYSVRLPWLDSEAPPWGAFFAVDPDHAVEFVSSLVRRADYKPGLPSVERSDAIARLEAELKELEAGEEKLIDDAREAGVGIEHRQEVIQRRDREARARQLQEEKIANRKAREEALEEWYGQPRRRAGHSQYLQREKVS